MAEQPEWLLCITNQSSSMFLWAVIICLFLTKSLQCLSRTANSNTLSWTGDCKLLSWEQTKMCEMEVELMKAKPRVSWSAGEVERKGVLVQAIWICVVICLSVVVCVHPCLCVCSYLFWSTAAGASEEAQPFLPVPFTLSQHTWAIKLCGSI